jgi:hypothetical protein
MKRPLVQEDPADFGAQYEGDPAEMIGKDYEDAPGEEEEAEDEGPSSPIHSGWTAGQQVMDSSADWAQPLKLEKNFQIIKFLDDQPYANYRRHWVERISAQGGKYNRPYTCLETVGRECPLCNIADKPQAVSAFNVALVGDDGQVILKTWDVGAKLFAVLKAYANDPMVGPLSKGYFAVNKTGGGSGSRRGGTTQTNVKDIKSNRLEEDYSIPEPTSALLAKAGRYDASVIQIPKRSEMDEVAAELAEQD